MFEEPSSWIVERQHVAGTAEWLTRRAARQQIGDPVLIRELWTKLPAFNLLDRRVDHRGVNERSTAIRRIPALVRPERFSAVRIAVNGRHRDEPTPLEADVQPASPGKQ